MSIKKSYYNISVWLILVTFGSKFKFCRWNDKQKDKEDQINYRVPYFREHTNTTYIAQFINNFKKYLLTPGYTFFALRYGTSHGELRNRGNVSTKHE